MGIRESKVSFLEYEEALKRVSDDELERLRAAFKRYSGNNATLLPKTAFINEIMSGLVPTRLAEQLFLTCGGSTKGILFRDLLVILVLITDGTLDEKVKFLFNLMSVDGTSITREDLENFYTACDGEGPIPNCINGAFWKSDHKISFEDFHEWVSVNPEFSAITRWLLEEQFSEHGIKLSCHDDKPSFYKSLANITKLEEKEVIELEKSYWKMKSLSLTGKYDFKIFKMHTHPPLPEQFVERFFQIFDKNNDDHIDFKEMVCGVSTFCRGLTKERLEACFDMFDVDKDGELNEEEMRKMAEGLLEVYKQYDDIDKTVDDVVNEITNKNDHGAIGMSEFRTWASTSVQIHEFLLLLSQVCHIIFGLKPALREEEGCIIRRWLDREKRIGLKPGSLHYIVTSKWWNTWKEYVHFQSCGVKGSLTPPDMQTSQQSPNHLSQSQSPNHLPVTPKHHAEDSVSPSKSSFKKRNNQIHHVMVSGHASKGQPPGTIDNASLLQPEPAEFKKLYNLTGEGGRLKQNVLLIHGKDYEALPEPIWRSLQLWYGCDVEVPRVVLEETKSGKPELELYPVPVLLYKHAPPPKSSGFSLNSIGINNFLSQIFGGNAMNFGGDQQQQTALVTPKKVLSYKAAFSKENTVKQIIVFIGQKLKIHPDDLRLWIVMGENENTLLEEEEKKVSEVPLTEGCYLLVEIRNRDLSWPEEMNSLVATRNFRERSNTGLLEKGATGLHNLGNTCFMNSAVQCLSNTKPLTQYFCSKLFLYELNKTNPLGMKGLLAKRYGDLVTDLWNGIYRSIAPVKLRWTIGRYAPRFNGFQQHDSQELLSFLLDGLHEDVNRVHDKPYIELQDSDGRPDYEVSKEAWENHLKRNQSIIVDLFQGMLKSQVKCLHCGHKSIRFDPFTFLSLPLPMESSFHVEIPVFLKDREQVVKYGLLLPPDATVQQARKELSKLCKVNTDNLLLVEVVGFTIRNFLLDNQKLSTTAIGYIFAYEVNIYDEHYLHNIPTPEHSLSADNISNTSNNLQQQQKVISANIGSNIELYEEQPSVTVNKNENQKNRSSKSKIKKAKSIFRSSSTKPTPKIVEIAPKEEKVSPEKEATEVLEVPGIVNASFSPTPTVASSARSISSSECVWDSNFHGIVVALNRKTIQATHYFLSWQKFHPVVFGVPCVISCNDDTTNRDVYEQILRHVSRYVTGEQHAEEEHKRYPFEVKCVDKEGHFCIVCPWYRFCRGCTVPCNDELFSFSYTYLAIDWDSTTIHLRYQQGLEKNYVNDSSIDACYKRLQEPISIEQCLKDFTKEEELGDDETWYCSKCKEHRKIAKKFDIWKLPAILVIHLKRFQLVNNRWVKSNKLVRFPSERFKPASYAHQEISQEDQTKITQVKSCDAESEENEQSSPSLDESTNNRNNETYNLYAMSCHAGMLNGGHYIAYAKNPNRKWYCYNDSSCKEIDIKVLENEAPYMLFYEKDGVNTIDYMPDIKEKDPINVQQEEDEFDKEVKKYCSIM